MELSTHTMQHTAITYLLTGQICMKRTFHEAFKLFIERQKRYKLKNGTINATAVARDLGVTPRTTCLMLNSPDYGPRKPVLDKICAVFGVTGDQIMGNSPFDWEVSANDATKQLSNTAVELISVFSLKRLYDDYKSVEHAINDRAYSEKFALPSKIADSEKMLLIMIEDDSNIPSLSQSDMVLVDVRKKPKLGDKVLALSGSQYLVRTLGEDKMLYADDRIYSPKKYDTLCGTCVSKISITNL